MMLDRSGNYKVGGNNTAVDTIISLSGAQNPASELIDGYKTMNAETMITMQPDYILISQRAWDSLGSKDKVLSAIPLLKNSPAGKSKNIIVIPSGALLVDLT
ncbi:periplasmic hemin-binding protein [Vibrio maritimus]|uniref:Periplasmic hemin-binding protein n=1 Tax=Vibrio maritimus TaxID=990268 RepID=A0A090SD67_9VIBR|nr:periplasmic hemin-binding protein [Vibrio maritimus]